MFLSLEKSNILFIFDNFKICFNIPYRFFHWKYSGSEIYLINISTTLVFIVFNTKKKIVELVIFF